MIGSRLSSMAKAPHLSVTYFHAHVYFDGSTANAAQQFQQRMKQEWSSSKQVRVHELHHQPIGPHPLPMFEA
jgi:DOPA 4,5-dioxygenase